MSSSTPNQDGVFGQKRFASDNNGFNALSFFVEQAIGGINSATLVKIMAVHAPDVPTATGTVDVLPLVEQLDGAGQIIEQATVFGIPYSRLQGGSNAFIIDPKVGDVGFCIFADRDISTVKSTLEPAPAASFRRFSYSDGFYVGGWFPQTAPARYVAITDDGIDIMSTGELNVTAQTMNAQITTGSLVAGTFVVTVPEFTIIGNLHVTGLVHCTWEGELIAVKYGGSGADLSATGGPGLVVKQSSTGAAFTVGPVESSEVITKIQLGDTFAVNQPFKIISGKAQHISSSGSTLPQVDGIVLAAGITDAFVPSAMNANQLYGTGTALTGSDDADLFLGSDGLLKATVPTLGAGDNWSIPLARRVTSTSFLFNPESPIRL